MIFHYTSQEGFKGIVREDGIHLWFSDARYMNDRSELVNAWPLFLKAAKELLNENRLSEETYDVIKDIEHDPNKFPKINSLIGLTTQKTIEIVKKREEGEFHRYICCFSREKDSLPMWNCYLKNDRNGYAIGLDLDRYSRVTCKIVDVNRENDRELRSDEITDTVDVVYSDKNKIRMFKDGLIDFEKDFSRKAEQWNKEQSILSLQKFFEECATSCKDYHFAYEKEVRMIATVKAPNTPNTEKEQYNNINFRFVHGLAIPYIEIHIPDKKHLKALTVSPRIGLNSNDVDTIESVRTYLKYLGYTHKIDILCSEIPLRYY